MERLRKGSRILAQILRAGFSLFSASTTRSFILVFILLRIWSLWQPPSWNSWLPDNREAWGHEDYPSLEEPGKQIRLLELFPGTANDELEARLFAAAFLELPFYEAVSYSWGSLNGTRTMTINGKRFHITDNLWAALKSIRTSYTSRIVWVDAICIDQRSNEEKQHQVGMMSHIYERAYRVLVLLAESPHPDWILDSGQSQWDLDWAAREANKDWPATAHWLHEMMDQEYWKRCWIVQEIRQARSIRVYFGSHWLIEQMPWSAFIKLVELYRSREPFNTDKVNGVLRLERLRRAKYRKGSSLDELLQEFGECFCSVQLDKIYAFLGIADDEPGRCLMPMYDKSPFQLYADLLAFYHGSEFHQNRRDIEIVHFAALVRTILSRKQASRPKTKQIAKFGVDPGTWSYHFCKKFPDSCNRQGLILEGVNALLNLLYMYRNASYLKQNESTWMIQDPESDKDWFSLFRREMSGPLLARGYLAGRVIKIGPTYKSYVADPSTIILWIRESIDTVSTDPSLLRQVAVLNKKLAAILGNPEEFKVRNFIQFKHHLPRSYQESHIFLGLDANDSLIMGVVPEDTPLDARLIQFWNTDATLVAMPQANWVGNSIATAAIIGRAGLVRSNTVNDTPSWDRPMDLTSFLPASNLSYTISMSIDMLSELSFDTVIQPGTMGGFEYSSQHSPRHWAFNF